MYEIFMQQMETKEKIKMAVRNNKLTSKQKELYDDINQWVFSNLKDNLQLNKKFGTQ